MTDHTVPNMPARVAVVDDSKSIRSWLRHVIDADPRLSVVGEAASGPEARDLLRKTDVDVMTLDVNMPGMSGIEFLERLMAHRPLPVVMVSSLTEAGSEAAIKAFSLGAVDCIEKPRSALHPNIASIICNRVYNASRAKVQARARPVPSTVTPPTRAQHAKWKDGIILIGSSTGGVTALEQLFAEIDDCDAPVVIAQHMPENFLRSFARRLNDHYARRFCMVEDGMELSPRMGVLALGKEVSTHLAIGQSGAITCKFEPPTETAVYRPCVDDMFFSAATAGLNGVGIVLTGMGRDGAKGLLALRGAGFTTFAQDEHSSAVYGMPKAAVHLGAAQHQADPAEIGRRVAQVSFNKSRNTKGIPV